MLARSNGIAAVSIIHWIIPTVIVTASKQGETKQISGIDSVEIQMEKNSLTGWLGQKFG